MYRVTWTIDIEADTAQEAVIKAQEYQRDPYSTATVFSVYPEGKPGDTVTIDTLELNQD